jgi:uncharacterized damage-inducible protein DinB
MYRTIDDFAEDYAQEREVLRALTDESLEQRVRPEGRSAGRLAWHITVSIPQIAKEAKLPGVEGSMDDDAVPSRASEIVAAYERASTSFVDALRAHWTDEQLAGQIEMYGMHWTRAATLAMLVKHEIHHRAQITVLMRQAGLAVPGCYGPAAEEWAAMGMPAMA